MRDIKLKELPISLPLVALIISGEAIFILPFVLARVFRPTVLEVFNISNLELGLIFSVYGIVAIFSYLFGGPLADKFNPRALIVAALVSTALGGIYMANIPSYQGLKLLFGFWGITTILLFWAALIRSTRFLGGDKFQGLSFGFLDGGRGLISALIGTMTVAIFTLFLPHDVEASSLAERSYALSKVIYFMVGFICVVALIVFFILPKKMENNEDHRYQSLDDVKNLLSLPTIWLQAVIIVCAYTGYKALSDFSLYANEVLLFNEIQSAKVGSFMLWIRPIAAISIAILTLKIKAMRLVLICFGLMFLGSLSFGFGWITPGLEAIFFTSMLATCTGVFALRGLYFAILKEAHVPLALTGTAVGFISLVGYTPDVFMGPLMGFLLDNNPGIVGHQHLFICLASFSFIGFLAALTFNFFSRKLNESKLNYLK